MFSDTGQKVGILPLSRDLIIVDSPPVLSVSDTRFITRFADMTVFLMKWGSTKLETATEAVRQLGLTGGKVDGVVDGLYAGRP